MFNIFALVSTAWTLCLILFWQSNIYLFQMGRVFQSHTVVSRNLFSLAKSINFDLVSQKLLFFFRWKGQSFNLKLVSAIFYQIFISHQLIALPKLWKMLFISSKKLFLFSRYSNFCISVFPSFSPCQPLP